MIAVGVTQQCVWDAPRNERRTELDVRWPDFLASCGLIAVPLPNDPALALAAVDGLALAGAVLSGGGDLERYGGTDPRRDATERALLARAVAQGMPILGVCRGMQAVVEYFGGSLVSVDEHVRVRHQLTGTTRTVNSYHRLAAVEVPAPLRPVARAGPVVEALRHDRAPICGVMWHPEREVRFDVEDVAMFRNCFGAG